MEQIKNYLRNFNKESNNIIHLIILGILVILIAIISYFYISTLQYIKNANEDFKTSFPGNFGPDKSVVLSVIPDNLFYQKDHQVGELIDIIFSLNTPNKKVSGVDVFFEYDPSFLKIQQSNNPVRLAESSGLSLQYLNIESSVFNIFPYLKIDEKKGRVVFSALSRPIGEFIGINGKVASLKFQILKKGTTEIKIDFTKGSTVDTNVAYAGRDILKDVNNLILDIK